MKKFFVSLLLILPFISAGAQTIVTINTEKLLKSIPAYVAAQDELASLNEKYKAAIQSEVDEIEKLYNDYQQKKYTLTASQRSAAENEILSREKSTQEKEKIYFGEDGIMSKKSDELLLPIKEKVDASIKAAALAGGYAMVVDLAIAQSVVYSEGAKDITEIVLQIYNTLK